MLSNAALRRRTLLAGFPVLVALLACQTGRMHQGTVLLTGKQPLATQLAIAQRVAAAVWGDGALKQRIVARFTTMREQDLVGMFLHWAKVRVDDGGGEAVVIQIGIRDVGDRVPADAVVEFVRAECQAELARDAEYQP